MRSSVDFKSIEGPQRVFKIVVILIEYCESMLCAFYTVIHHLEASQSCMSSMAGTSSSLSDTI